MIRGEISMATKYKCPYCDHMRMTKDELIGHIDEEHREMIPEGWSAGRLAFKIIYKKDHGTCVVCKRPTEWNDKRCKYQRLCGDPNCRKALRDAALKNHIKVYKCKTLLNSPIHQEKMLRNRKISGEYKFRDGGKIGYVGSYEKNFLEFMDKTLDVKSDEIIEPGPVFEYDMDGKKHFWITDFLYVPYNLVIEVKDGGDNPNKRNMPIYRKKEAMKDKLITEKGTYNYLKLTNNNFAQLLEIFAVMRMQMMNDEPENRRVVIRVNESGSILNEAVSGRHDFLLPLDPRELKDGQYFACMNTHVPNIALQTVQLSAFFSAIITLIWGAPYIPQLIFMLKFSTMINAATVADQIFARDFVIIGKDGYSDDLLGYPIRSVDYGKVVEVKKYQMPYGNCVIIEHSGCYSLYAHILENGIKVKEGQVVKAGQVIGLCGSTGNSSAPHLHFEMTLTKPGNTITAIPKMLNGFERFNCKEFSVGDIYIDGYKDPYNFIKKLYENASKGSYKTSNGNIPSFCFIKK